MIQVALDGVDVDGLHAIAGKAFRENEVDEAPASSRAGARAPQHDVEAHRGGKRSLAKRPLPARLCGPSGTV